MLKRKSMLKMHAKKTYVLFLIVLLFVISAGTSLSLLSKSQELLLWNERASGRALVQLVILQQSYLSVLMQKQRGDDVDEQLLISYDLTWSAYETLLKGSKKAYFIQGGRRMNKLTGHFNLFKESDPMQVKLSGERLTIALHNTRQAHAYIVELLNHEFQGFSQQTHLRDFELVRLNKVMIVGLLGLTFSGAFFLFIILRERRRMAYLAYHDALTDIGNRSALKEKITKLQLDGEPFSVLLLDIDGFKLVNDNYGHDVGDKLLIQLSQSMKQICGVVNVVGRLGGDEFAIIYRSKNSVERIALKLLDITERAINIKGFDCDVGLSIGICHASIKHESWVDILKEADDAMYQAKQNGGNQYQIYVAR